VGFNHDVASAVAAAFDAQVCPDKPRHDACRWEGATAGRGAAAPAGSCLADAWQGHGRRRGKSWTESLGSEPRLHTTKARVMRCTVESAADNSKHPDTERAASIRHKADGWQKQTLRPANLMCKSV
jgi:hypothetical protein